MAKLKVLIVTTTWWPSAAYLALASKRAGVQVFGLSPVGNPLRKLKFIRGGRTYSARRWHASLVQAITSFEPDLLIPTDDRAVEHIHKLYADVATVSDRPGRAVRAVIERSLGAPSGYHLSGTRHEFLEEMRMTGVLVPAGIELSSIDDLSEWCAAHAPPWVLKAEGSWGGAGVILAGTVEDARNAYSELSSPLAVHKALRFRLVDRDPFALARFFHRKKRKVMAQAHIRGRQVTCMVASWQGRRIASVNAEVMSTQGCVGASTVLRLINSSYMDDVAAAAAERLGLSGFFGLDFIIEESTERCFLIEMNPRATQLGHIRVQGTDLVTRLYEAAGADPVPSQSAPDHGPVIAFFPQALRFMDSGATLKELPIDVPWGEPDLVEELLRLPWTKRGVVARLEAAFRQNDAFGSAIAPRLIDEIRAELERRTITEAYRTRTLTMGVTPSIS
jgi:ATP-grasp domain